MASSPVFDVEVTNISRHGFWILLDERELFLPFKEFPWFAKATVDQILGVERPDPHHLYWPELDVDLAVESIEDPGKFPLKAWARGVPRPGPAMRAPTDRPHPRRGS